MTTRLLLAALSLLLCTCPLQANGIVKKIENHILYGHKDSAAALLQQLAPTDYTRQLQAILDGNADYKAILVFISNLETVSLLQYEQLDQFIKKNVRQPDSKEPLELDYVRIKWQQISNLCNELNLDNATAENELLKRYIYSFSDTSRREWKQARLYANTHDIVLCIIQNDIEQGSKRCLEDEKIAQTIKDTFLWINAKFHYANFLQEEGRLDDYIQNVQACLELENQLQTKTSTYLANIGNLLDALIYKGDYDEKYVESLLDLLYSNPRYKLYSYSYYTKYLSRLPLNSPAAQAVFQRFKVENLLAFCDTVSSQTEGIVNNKEFFHLIMECSRALLNHEYYKDAFSYKNWCISLNREIYSQELSQSLADYKTQTIKREKEAELETERQKKQFFGILAIVISLFLVLSVYLIFKVNQKTKRLEISNKEKEMLLKEIHHRVKNNFQLVISFMRLQEKFADTMSLPQFIRQLERKLNSMAMVHEMLYKDSNTQNVPLATYLHELGDYIIQSLGSSEADVELVLAGDAIKTNIDRAISIGLVVNEIITNSIKYAHQEELQIRIELTEGQSFFLLSVSDNGVGFPADFNPENSSSLGCKVILLLMSQINAKVSWKNENGAHWVCSIPY